MDTKALMWVIVGILLIVGGLVSVMREGGSVPPGSRPSSVAPVQEGVDTTQVPFTRQAVESDQVQAVQKERNLDTGFEIDPIRGLRRKDKNQEYFG